MSEWKHSTLIMLLPRAMNIFMESQMTTMIYYYGIAGTGIFRKPMSNSQSKFRRKTRILSGSIDKDIHSRSKYGKLRYIHQ
jgi:hypothetical protein